jgi:hypothetical protein
LAAKHPCGRRRDLIAPLLLPQISKAHWCISAAGMVRIALCWARAVNRSADAAREGCAAGLMPGTGDVAFEVDVDLSTCDFAALAEAAGAQLPPRHRAVAFHFQGKAIGPGSAPLASYGVRRGDTLRADVRREPFELARTGPPLQDGCPPEVVGDGARE